MNFAIVKGFNDIITWKDDLYILGDIMLGNNEDGIKLFNQLPGKIHLVWGNHDTDIRKELIEKCHNVVEIIGYAGMLKYDKYNFYLSHYPTATSNYDDDKKFSQRIFCLSGHTHSKDLFDEKCGSYNVALDAHNCKPVSIEQIIKDLKDKYN